MNLLEEIFSKMATRLKVMALIFFIIDITEGNAQNNQELAQQFIDQADEVMKATFAVDIARDLYIQAVNFDPENIVGNYRAGEIFLNTVHKERATSYLMKVSELDPDYKFNIYYMVGRGYQYSLEFDKAIEYYEKYKSKLATQSKYKGDDKVALEEVERRIFECRNGKEFLANPGKQDIINMGTRINSEFEDYAPVLNSDESQLVFTTRRREGNLNRNVDNDNKPYEDVFISYKIGDTWAQAKNIGRGINTLFHDSNLAFSPDGNQLFIYKDDNRGDIFVASRTSGDSWSEPIPFSDRINSKNPEKSITRSVNGQFLIFSSERSGGLGGLDLYFSTLNKKGVWNKPTNLKAPINTKFDEDSPYLDYDSKTLYFSSTGGKGMGGFDIFKTVYDSITSAWSKPENLGYPINTPDDDIYFVKSKDGERAYYSSVKDEGLGYTDIYLILLNEKEEVIAEEPKKEEPVMQPVTLVVDVIDFNTKGSLDATVNLESRNGTKYPLRRVSEGKYRIQFKNKSDVEMVLSSTRQGYMYQSQSLTIPSATTSDTNINKTISMEKLAVGYSSVIRNIYFQFKSAVLKEESYEELEKLNTLLNENPNIIIQISGHTDNTGGVKFNLELSKKRAEAVSQYLVNKSIDKRRIIAKGFGERHPAVSNDDEREGRELNRRVEFIVLRNIN